MEIKWDDGFEIRVRVEERCAVVSANAEGLRSLAGILLSLAEDSSCAHLHLDAYNSLEDGSDELILERIK